MPREDVIEVAAEWRVSRQTLHTWLARYEAGGLDDLGNRSKGFSGELLDQVVSTITSNRDMWLETIMNEARQLRPGSNSDVLRSSVVIFVATLIGHMIPLLPFVFLSRSSALMLGIVLAGVVLFGVGTYQAVTRVGRWWLEGPKILLIGLGAAAVGFAIGRLFQAGPG